MLPGLPIEYWDQNHLGTILAPLGALLRLDEVTQTKGRTTNRAMFARALVELDLAKDPIDGVYIQSLDGIRYQKFTEPTEKVQPLRTLSSSRLLSLLSTTNNPLEKTGPLCLREDGGDVDQLACTTSATTLVISSRVSRSGSQHWTDQEQPAPGRAPHGKQVSGVANRPGGRQRGHCGEIFTNGY
ncbi:hypothetical protein MRB53_014043 [Persea americana]|uniref:Uncharacterized protein n=1 Tax=Persea americana TaxID=3435 RepID=A0ACC2KA42_PERAE|nr:hypothetical protein MRB53_014043 [Persea americana]